MVQGIVGCAPSAGTSIHVVKGSRANDYKNDCDSNRRVRSAYRG